MLDVLDEHSVAATSAAAGHREKTRDEQTKDRLQRDDGDDEEALEKGDRHASGAFSRPLSEQTRLGRAR
jgi:hypothetical protein